MTLAADSGSFDGGCAARSASVPSLLDAVDRMIGVVGLVLPVSLLASLLLGLLLITAGCGPPS